MRALSLVALLVLASAGQAQPPGKGPFAPAAPPEKARWEYAEMFFRSTPAAPPKEGEERGPPTVTIRWSTGKEEVQVTGWATFAEKLKAGGFKKDNSLTLQRMQVLDHLGSEGWELIESATTTAPAVAQGTPVTASSRTMLFKRRVR